MGNFRSGGWRASLGSARSHRIAKMRGIWGGRLWCFRRVAHKPTGLCFNACMLVVTSETWIVLLVLAAARSNGVPAAALS
eukprot:4643237-Amphidinium_carterae.1